MVAESGSLESQLEAMKLKSKEVKDKKVKLTSLTDQAFYTEE